MRISLFESDNAIFFKIFDVFLSEIACGTGSLDINTRSLLNVHINYESLVGEIYEKFPLVVSLVANSFIQDCLH
jgi:hypothetical protein